MSKYDSNKHQIKNYGILTKLNNNTFTFQPQEVMIDCVIIGSNKGLLIRKATILIPHTTTIDKRELKTLLKWLNIVNNDIPLKEFNSVCIFLKIDSDFLTQVICL